MTSFKPGEIILVPFPFSDLSGTKKRPALVLAVIDSWQELICVMLTSSPKGTNEVPLSQWKQAGLPKYTVARVHRLFTIEQSLVLRTVGSADENDFQTILYAIISLLKGKH